MMLHIVAMTHVRMNACGCSSNKIVSARWQRITPSKWFQGVEGRSVEHRSCGKGMAWQRVQGYTRMRTHTRMHAHVYERKEAIHHSIIFIFQQHCPQKGLEYKLRLTHCTRLRISMVDHASKSNLFHARHLSSPSPLPPPHPDFALNSMGSRIIYEYLLFSQFFFLFLFLFLCFVFWVFWALALSFRWISSGFEWL